MKILTLEEKIKKFENETTPFDDYVKVAEEMADIIMSHDDLRHVDCDLLHDYIAEAFTESVYHGFMPEEVEEILAEECCATGNDWIITVVKRTVPWFCERYKKEKKC